MKLTGRDEEILKAVHRHRFLRSCHVTGLVSGSRQQVLRRLQMLFHLGYLERPVCQLDYYQQAGSRSLVYGLASRGAAHLRYVCNVPFTQLHWTSRNRAVKRLFLEHALMVSDIMVSLEIACRKRGDVRLLIEHEIPLPDSTRNESDPFCWQVKVSGKDKIGVIPDRVFALEFADINAYILYFLEADRGTMPIRNSGMIRSSFERKFIAYQETWRQKIPTSRFGLKRVRVLVITDNEERAGHLRDECASLNVGKSSFLFSTRGQVVKSNDTLSDPWVNSLGQTMSLAV